MAAENGERQDEHAALFPLPQSITIAGRKIELKQMGIAQISRIIQSGAPIAVSRQEEGLGFLEWVAQHPDEANPLIAAASGLDVEWVGSLTEFDRVTLAVNLKKLNADFFVRCLPLLAMDRKADEILNGLGPTPSTSSSPADIPTPKTTHHGKPSSTSRPSVVLNEHVGAIA